VYSSGHTSRKTPSFLIPSVRFSFPVQIEHWIVNFSAADRMPTVIGHFISRHVYDSKLKTEHDIHVRACCRFVDVSNGKETKKGVSWVVCLPYTTTDHRTC